MKKLFLLLAVAGCMTFTACTNNQATTEQPKEGTEQCDKEKPCCKEMTEEQKAECEARKKAAEDWQNWENIAEDRKVELLNERKAAYDKMQEMKKEQEAKKAAFEAAMNNWDKLSIDEKKAAFDAAGCGGCCKKGEGKGCCKGGDKAGCHKGEGKGCSKEGGKCPKGEQK
ncbi:MAG: hypothetical protein SPL42_02945 [Bacteroidales bacterium]|nr:hypothetical protein [Bacteroidales bacterium]MDY6347377.1 hypothetical protein [Bacteroidales bacterium]